MCNIWTNEHVFIWSGNSSTVILPPEMWVCKCGAFYFNGKPANLTYSVTVSDDFYRELRVKKDSDVMPL